MSPKLTRIGQVVAELGSLAAVVWGIDRLAGFGWALIAGGALGFFYIEMGELLGVVLAMRPRRRARVDR